MENIWTILGCYSFVAYVMVACMLLMARHELSMIKARSPRKYTDAKVNTWLFIITVFAPISVWWLLWEVLNDDAV